MGWERGQYYTRSRRVGRRFVREYIGGGSIGQMAAARDAAQRAQRAEQHQAWQEEREQMEAEEALIESIDRLCQVAMCGTLEAAGYHQHDRGEWRKRRG